MAGVDPSVQSNQAAPLAMPAAAIPEHPERVLDLNGLRSHFCLLSGFYGFLSVDLEKIN